SSRRRHTRFSRDWSSDVCSSDLPGGQAHVVATVPPQHMFGMEMSVLLPLLGGTSVHAGRPFFPADIAGALEELPGNRLLVTTPVHLRALVESGAALPPLSAIITATAPLAHGLAAAAEQRFNAPVREFFGSTETCIIASRRTAIEQAWTPFPGVRLQPRPDGTLVQAPQLAAPVALADLIESDAAGRFVLRGRQADLLEIAGKRASLGELTRHLLAIPGVEDGVVLQLDEADALGVSRIAAVAVAPDLDEGRILDALRRAVDPVFLPRRLRLVPALPRNETGKLPRAAQLQLLARPGRLRRHHALRGRLALLQETSFRRGRVRPESHPRFPRRPKARHPPGLCHPGLNTARGCGWCRGSRPALCATPRPGPRTRSRRSPRSPRWHRC